ncbi:MAG TPA: P-II family nitrogen regulator [Clostridia bacterium]|nr:P-II family nitrogen regulator [Clostridia bacterium]
MKNCASLELISVIVNFGTGSKVLAEAKRSGITGGTVLLAKGTINSNLLDFLGLSDQRKEMVLMVADKETADRTLEKLNEVFAFAKPHHGIAFTLPVSSIIGSSVCKIDEKEDDKGVETAMYQAITVIVDKGKAEDVIDAAKSAGSSGGTIINARGSGIHETSKLFSMEIEPEKEIVLILANNTKSEAIIAEIREKLKIEEPGNGIIYIQNVNKAYGLYE